MEKGRTLIKVCEEEHVKEDELCEQKIQNFVAPPQRNWIKVELKVIQ